MLSFFHTVYVPGKADREVIETTWDVKVQQMLEVCSIKDTDTVKKILSLNAIVKGDFFTHVKEGQELIKLMDSAVKEYLFKDDKNTHEILQEIVKALMPFVEDDKIQVQKISNK